jgi:uncharacterized protein DUF1800
MDRRAFLFAPGSARTGSSPLRVSSGLQAHTAPLEKEDVGHALRRCIFGANPVAAPFWVGRTASEFADGLLDAALSQALPAPPAWADQGPPGRGSTAAEREAYRRQNNEWLAEYRVEWLRSLLSGGLRERMTLIWHNHFVTGVSKYRHAVYAYRYVQTLRTHALGNFKEFVREIGLNPAMLIYLDGIQNRSGAANENYARELMELFTMGPTGPDGSENYTQTDVQELARALTGWQVETSELRAVFNQRRFDSGQKTIFGKPGSYGYYQVVDLLFAERAEPIARFVCDHLYRSLVFAEPSPAVTAELAAQFVAENFEIAPVVRTLLKSAHFFDPEVRGSQIKSPLDHNLGLMVETVTEPSDAALRNLYRMSRQNGMNLLDPPNVAGWPGHHDWMDTTRLPYRWFMSDVILGGRGASPPDVVTMAENIHDAADTEAAFRLPTAIVEHLIPVSASILDIPEITEDFGGDLVNFPIPDWVTSAPPHQRNLAKIFLGGAPWYEWSLYVPGATERIRSFLRHIAQYPEFQLA